MSYPADWDKSTAATDEAAHWRRRCKVLEARWNSTWRKWAKGFVAITALVAGLTSGVIAIGKLEIAEDESQQLVMYKLMLSDALYWQERDNLGRAACEVRLGNCLDQLHDQRLMSCFGETIQGQEVNVAWIRRALACEIKNSSDTTVTRAWGPGFWGSLEFSKQ